MSVAHSIQMMKRIPPAIRKSLRIFKVSGNGISRAAIRLANLLKAPMGHTLQEIRAPKKALMIKPGQASAHMTTEAKFLEGSGGPKKSIRIIERKIGTTALCSTAGNRGLKKACLMGRIFNKLYRAFESALLLSRVKSCLLTTPPGEIRTALLIAFASSRSLPGQE